MLGFKKDLIGYNKEREDAWEDFKTNKPDEYKALEDRVKAIEIAPFKSLPPQDQQTKIDNAFRKITEQVWCQGIWMPIYLEHAFQRVGIEKNWEAMPGSQKKFIKKVFAAAAASLNNLSIMQYCLGRENFSLCVE